MGPKIEAVYQFVTTTGNRAAVGSLDDLAAVVAGTAGTQVSLDPKDDETTHSGERLLTRKQVVLSVSRPLIICTTGRIKRPIATATCPLTCANGAACRNRTDDLLYEVTRLPACASTAAL